MDLSWNEWLMLAGGIIAALGVIILWTTGKHDLKGAAIDSVWQTARGRRTADNPTALDMKWNAIRNEASVTGKARRTIFTVIAHFLAQLLAVAATIMVLVGIVMLGLGYYWWQ